MTLSARLHELTARHPKFLQKGGLCVGLVITKTAGEKGLPLNPESLRTEEGGQVAGLGKASVQGILLQHGITKVLAEEGGRTSRGSLGLMSVYVDFLNNLALEGLADIDAIMGWWVGRVRDHFNKQGPKLRFDPSKSVTANIEDLFAQIHAIQKEASGVNYVGAMLQHLVGAKMDLVLGAGQVEHHGFSVADHSTERPGDFAVDGVAIHVTTHPSEALIRKTGVNLQQGLKPVIVTYGKGVALADLLLQQSEWAGRVDVLDIGQFLMANVVERSFFRATDYKATLSAILNRYNEIVEACETDPVLKIRL